MLVNLRKRKYFARETILRTPRVRPLHPLPPIGGDHAGNLTSLSRKLTSRAIGMFRRQVRSSPGSSSISLDNTYFICEHLSNLGARAQQVIC